MPKEFDIIERYFKTPAAMPEIPVGIGDDAAVLPPCNGYSLTVSVDTLNAGVHFLADSSPSDIAQKALRVNLSDMAAMGAVPKYFTLSLSLPKSEEAWLQAFSASLLQVAEKYGVSLIGGDTTQGPLSVSIQILGQVGSGTALLRSGAGVGDQLWVSGCLGDAAHGLALLEKSAVSDANFSFFKQAYYQPEPQLALGQALAGLATSAIDISDGLLADLGHILKASQKGARVNLDSVPVSNPLENALGRASAQRLALSSGDDYQLCFSVPKALGQQVQDKAAALGVAITCIGEVIEGKELSLHSQGKDLPYEQCGFEHFAN